MSLKIIGSGFGRTGTLSLKAALEILGFGPCYHMQEVIKRPSHIKKWQQIGRGKSVPWQSIFRHFQATVDYPASTYYRELLAAYPDAKVIHTVRDPERWYDSTAETIFRSMHGLPFWAYKLPWPMGNFIDLQEQIVWQGVFNGRFLDRTYAIQRFHEYTEEVKQNVPPEKLLIFQVKDGWEPLCNFLELPVPGVPFPRVNDRENILRQFKRLRQTLHLLPFAAATAVLTLLYLLQNKDWASFRKLTQSDDEYTQTRRA
ncbi:MAG: sulfotransferase family protein [Ardenticatenaceae bacterium]|nr:sulfotransferase family protein [Ardenticatenaceae bacterium]